MHGQRIVPTLAVHALQVAELMAAELRWSGHKKRSEMYLLEKLPSFNYLFITLPFSVHAVQVAELMAAELRCMYLLNGLRRYK
jgi:hypothetical protein